jgi:hypothetical protein
MQVNNHNYKVIHINIIINLNQYLMIHYYEWGQ